MTGETLDRDLVGFDTAASSSKCADGRWLCTNRTCPRTCSILGDMNVWTFDGKQYALVSPCNQVLVEVSFLHGANARFFNYRIF